MKNLDKIPKIKRLAEKFGTPLEDVQFIGDGIVISYKVGPKKLAHKYSDADRGIEEEILRLEQLLAIQI